MLERVRRQNDLDAAEPSVLVSLPFIGLITALCAFFILFASQMSVDPARGKSVLSSAGKAFHLEIPASGGRGTGQNTSGAEGPASRGVGLSATGPWRVERLPEQTRVIASLGSVFVTATDEVSQSIFPILDEIAAAVIRDRLRVSLNLIPESDIAPVSGSVPPELRRLHSLGSYLRGRSVDSQSITLRAFARPSARQQYGKDVLVIELTEAHE